MTNVYDTETERVERAAQEIRDLAKTFRPYDTDLDLSGKSLVFGGGVVSGDKDAEKIRFAIFDNSEKVVRPIAAVCFDARQWADFVAYGNKLLTAHHGRGR